MVANDTIVAISTPLGESGIGIIRISGPHCESLANKLFRPRSGIAVLRSHTLYYGDLLDPNDGEPIDEILAVLMKAPKTYTKEDCLEFHCHGGLFVLKKALEATVRAGARLAEPGEFTKRAFLNGRIDLSQAEAVIDLIRSKNPQGLRVAKDQLEGKLSTKTNELKNRLMQLLTEIEFFIDFQEEDFTNPPWETVSEKLDQIILDLEALCKSYRYGRTITEGYKVLLFGKTNVGKSSIFNKLINENRALVTEYPGTTRDFLEEWILIEGIPIRLIDSAGLRDSSDRIEILSQRVTERKVQESDLLLFVLDGSQPLDDQDLKHIWRIQERPVLILFNKVDLPQKCCREKVLSWFRDPIGLEVSAIKGSGFEELRNAIVRQAMQGLNGPRDDTVVTNLRHQQSLEESLHCLKGIRGYLSQVYPLPEIVSFEIQQALRALGRITGEFITEEVLDRIFRTFCIGK